MLRPGGWLAARTPNKWGMIGIGARAVPNDLHTRVLRRLQPDRKAEDVFPVRYQMNTRKDLRRAVPGASRADRLRTQLRAAVLRRVVGRLADRTAGRPTDTPEAGADLMVFVRKAG